MQLIGNFLKTLNQQFRTSTTVWRSQYLRLSFKNSCSYRWTGLVRFLKSLNARPERLKNLSQMLDVGNKYRVSINSVFSTRARFDNTSDAKSSSASCSTTWTTAFLTTRNSLHAIFSCTFRSFSLPPCIFHMPFSKCLEWTMSACVVKYLYPSISGNLLITASNNIRTATISQFSRRFHWFETIWNSDVKDCLDLNLAVNCSATPIFHHSSVAFCQLQVRAFYFYGTSSKT